MEDSLVLVVPTETIADVKYARKGRNTQQPAKDKKQKRTYASIAIPEQVKALLLSIKKDMSFNSKAPWGQVLETLAQHFLTENEEIKALKAEVTELKKTQKVALKTAHNLSKSPKVVYADGRREGPPGPPPPPTHFAPPGPPDDLKRAVIQELDERLTPGGTLEDWGLTSPKKEMNAAVDCVACAKSCCTGCILAGQSGAGKAAKKREKQLAAEKAALEKAAREAEKKSSH